MAPPSQPVIHAAPYFLQNVFFYKMFSRPKPWHSLSSPATGFAGIWRLPHFFPMQTKKEPQNCGSFETKVMVRDLAL